MKLQSLSAPELTSVSGCGVSVLQYQGYTCPLCGCWVQQGMTHICPYQTGTTFPSPPPVTTNYGPRIEALEKRVKELEDKLAEKKRGEE